jgi:hypothetical protein
MTIDAEIFSTIINNRKYESPWLAVAGPQNKLK